ncbi:hypothetical protein A2U01_0094631, partial [Trifolium medium]|nr:hypothetical protein [Trifolium medium]
VAKQPTGDPWRALARAGELSHLARQYSCTATLKILA